MIAYLKNMLHLKKTVTFGSIPGRYDVVIRPGDTNKVVQELKKQYEPVFGFCRREQDDVGKSKGGRAFRSFCRPGK